MATPKIQGAYTALVTPFKDNGDVDWDGLKRNVEFQLREGISGLLPTGTTGESPTLDWAEHEKVIARTAKLAGGKCPVVAGTGSNSTQEAVEATKHIEKMGVDGALLVDCYYNGPSSSELRRNYHAVVAEACPNIGIVPYVIPSRTTTALSPEDLAILANEYPNVVAVKEATGDLERMARTRALVGSDFCMMSGDDGLTFEMMTRPDIAASGVISVVSNIVPRAVEAMTSKALSGDIEAAEKIRQALDPLFEVVTVSVENPRTLPSGKQTTVSDKFRNPLPIKVLMNAFGMPAGPCRKPLGTMTQNAVDIVRQAARKSWEIDPGIFEPVANAYEVNIEERLSNDKYWDALADDR